MSTITKEWLQQNIADMEDNHGLFPGDLDDDHGKVLAALRIALASLEAEPVISHVGSKNALDDIVAFIKSNRNPTLKDHNQVSERLFQDNCHGLSNHVIEYIKQIGEELEELRSTQDTAPPAPVSMKDHQIRELVNELRDIAIEYHGTQQLRERIARAVRDAMLQGAAGNSPVIPDAYNIEAFGVFRATDGENGLMLDVERFHFETGSCPQISKDKFVPKFAVQAIINRLQKYCDNMEDDELIDIFSSAEAPQQEVK